MSAFLMPNNAEEIYMYTALTIAGSDSSGGAGIQADIKTMTALGVYGMTAITALTAQNTTGVKSIKEVDTDFLRDQLNCVFDDIYPDAVKTGMLPNAGIIEVVADCLKQRGAKQLVIDPVMVSTSGSALINEQAVNTLKTKLFPLKGLVTPNIPEAEVLSDINIETGQDMIRAARIISQRVSGSPAILIKGGHERNTANDLLYSGDNEIWFNGERIDNPNTHGTGCTLSSAIACNLALGYSMEDSVGNSKRYISGALKSGLNLGKGSGPLNHVYLFEDNFDSKASAEWRIYG